ncbi:hypothetical protein SK128_023705 [Halocaridina rubra]|uniref:Ig-like domain-containing protein n=1 Tax=Halocaridina rubra TaxID=373956 RepID=A0AAN8XQ87_HALRR
MPKPSVVWFKDTHLLDSHMESEDLEHTTQSPSLPILGNTTLAPGSITTPHPVSTTFVLNTKRKEPFNMLILGPLTRSDLKQARNIRSSVKYRDPDLLQQSPGGVVIRGFFKLLRVWKALERSESIEQRLCWTFKRYLSILWSRNGFDNTHTGSGNRKGVSVSTSNILQMAVLCCTFMSIMNWPDQLESLHLQTSPDGNVTTSTLLLTPGPRDDGTILICIADNHATDTRMQDTWKLAVQYTPKAKASFGSSLNKDNIKEGDDVYFECSIQANPKVSHVTWRHNNKVLLHNISGGVIISNQSLVLQKVVKAQAGRYSCHAHNVIGDGSSSPLRLDVKYAPICSPGQITTYPVDRYEDAEVTCSVQANPLQASFQWTFNNTADTIDVPQGRFTSSSSHSIITYTPMTSLDYGTLLCWASNEIGTQNEPCVFHIVPAGKPDPPINCSVSERTRVSVKIDCEEGSSGGLTQTFVLEASMHNGQHTLNATSDTPSFFVSTKFIHSYLICGAQPWVPAPPGSAK